MKLREVSVSDFQEHVGTPLADRNVPMVWVTITIKTIYVQERDRYTP